VQPMAGISSCRSRERYCWYTVCSISPPADRYVSGRSVFLILKFSTNAPIQMEIV
jgi:hypothetical protein